MNVHLTLDLEQFVQSKLQSGRYSSASEVVGEALRLMEHRDENRAIQLQELRNRMDRALAESNRAAGVDGEEFMQGLTGNLEAGNRRNDG